MNTLMAHHSGQTVEKVKQDTERDNFLTAQDAVEYGLVDRIVQTRDEEVGVATAGSPAKSNGDNDSESDNSLN